MHLTPLSWRHACAALMVGSAALLAACGGGGGSDDNGVGTLSVRLTDGQSCSYGAVFVSVEQVRVHRNANAAEDADGWEELDLSPARRVDLMTLRNGAFQELGTLPLDAGDYSQVRLVLADNAGGPPFANQLTLEDGTELALTTPSAQQSGLKLNVQMSIEAGETAELVLDFDPCKSVVKAGNSGMYLLKPVITAYFEEVSAIAGTVIEGAVVSAQVDGETVKSTVADADGGFVLWPMLAGTYDVVVTEPTRANAALTGVVVPEADTTVNVGLLDVPVNNGSGEVPGMVSANVDLVASVSARQVVDADTTIEVASVPLAVAAAGSTAYSFTLAVGDPVSLPWMSGTAGYAFAAIDPASLGDYVIRAAADGFATQSADVTGLAAGAVAPSVDFVFAAP
jgi:hypothetical protein